MTEEDLHNRIFILELRLKNLDMLYRRQIAYMSKNAGWSNSALKALINMERQELKLEKDGLVY